MESIAKRIDGLTSSATNIVNTQAKIFENMYKPEGGASLFDAITVQGSQDKEAYRQSLIAQLAAKRRGN